MQYAPLNVVCVQIVADHLKAPLVQLDCEGGVLESDEVEEDLSGGGLELVGDSEDLDKVDNLLDHSFGFLPPTLLVKKTFPLFTKKRCGRFAFVNYFFLCGAKIQRKYEATEKFYLKYFRK